MGESLNEALARRQLVRKLPSPAARRQLRVSLGLSLDHIAHELGVTRPCVSLWERGRRTPRPAHLGRYLSLLRRLAREGQADEP